MATMPSAIKVGRHRYRVVNDVAEWNSLSNGTGVRHSDHGATHHHWSLIAINPTDSPSQQADSLLHEVLHVIWFVASLDHMPEGDREEPTVARLTPWLSLVLCDNPDMMAFLNDPEVQTA